MTLFQNPFTISQIISIYEYFELICFEELRENIDESFTRIIGKEKEEKIEKFFSHNSMILINKLIISTTIRKFISRYLVGERYDFEIKDDSELFGILIYREDCWDREIYINSQFESVIKQLKILDIKVEEILHLYDLLGGDYILFKEIKQSKKEKIEKEEIVIKKKSKKRIGKKGIF